MTLAIEASGLAKSFGDTRAVDGVELAVRTGSVYGVLGPNGAGKTTTIRMLATLLRPDAGSARVLGHDIVADADRAAEAVAELSRSGIGIAAFSLGQPSLDEVFLALTGHVAEEDPVEAEAAATEEERAA